VVIFEHSSLIIFDGVDPGTANIQRQYSLQGGRTTFDRQTSQSVTFELDTQAFRDPGGRNVITVISPPPGMSARQFANTVIRFAESYRSVTSYRFYGPNSNSAAAFPLYGAGAQVPTRPLAIGLGYYRPRP